MNKFTQVFQLLSDPRVAKLPRLAVVLAVVYLISPVDLVPDLLFPVAGYLDDITLVWLSLRWLFKQRDPLEAIPVEGKPLPPGPPGPPER
jgi:uncharacterized membrane protein YkvA (DUF1232 family)